MYTLEEYRARYARSSSQELIDLLAIDQNSFTPAARQALAEETARRGLARGMLVESGEGDVDRPELFVYPKAPLSERLGAYIVDSIIGYGPVIMAWVFNVLFHIGTESPTTRTINLVATIAWSFYYSWTKDARPNGQSIGKKMFGLMVVGVETDRPCTLGQSIGRGLVLSLLSGIPVLGWLIEPITVFVSDEGRRIGDRVAGTQVIRASVYEASTHSAP